MAYKKLFPPCYHMQSTAVTLLKVSELWCETEVAGTEKLEVGENSDTWPAQLIQGSGAKGRG